MGARRHWFPCSGSVSFVPATNSRAPSPGDVGVAERDDHVAVRVELHGLGQVLIGPRRQRPHQRHQPEHEQHTGVAVGRDQRHHANRAQDDDGHIGRLDAEHQQRGRGPHEGEAAAEDEGARPAAAVHIEPVLGVELRRDGRRQEPEHHEREAGRRRDGADGSEAEGDEEQGQREPHVPAGDHPPPRVPSLAQHLGAEVREEGDPDEGRRVAVGQEDERQPHDQVGDRDADAEEPGGRAHPAQLSEPRAQHEARHPGGPRGDDQPGEVGRRGRGGHRDPRQAEHEVHGADRLQPAQRVVSRDLRSGEVVRHVASGARSGPR